MKRYGLIGYPLSHSFSKNYFTEKFQREGLKNVVYENFETADLNKLYQHLSADIDLGGLNVTIPYKKNIIQYLDSADDIVNELNACNCVRITNGKWAGYNTDVIGFERSFSKNLQSHHRYALVLGTGGSSKAVEYILRKKGIQYLVVSRDHRGENIIGYKDINSSLLEKYTVIINTTPEGMYPNVEGYPKLDYDSITPQHYFFDLIYNPERTVFLQKAAEHGASVQNGYEMLVEQAEESWKIWNS